MVLLGAHPREQLGPTFGTSHGLQSLFLESHGDASTTNHASVSLRQQKIPSSRQFSKSAFPNIITHKRKPFLPPPPPHSHSQQLSIKSLKIQSFPAVHLSTWHHDTVWKCPCEARWGLFHFEFFSFQQHISPCCKYTRTVTTANHAKHSCLWSQEATHTSQGFCKWRNTYHWVPQWDVQACVQHFLEKEAADVVAYEGPLVISIWEYLAHPITSEPMEHEVMVSKCLLDCHWCPTYWRKQILIQILVPRLPSKYSKHSQYSKQIQNKSLEGAKSEPLCSIYWVNEVTLVSLCTLKVTTGAVQAFLSAHSTLNIPTLLLKNPYSPITD